jgi:hypothetical protein
LGNGSERARRCSRDGDRIKEAITTSTDGLDISGMLGGIVQRRTELVDGAAEIVVEIDEGPVRPQSFAQLFAGDDLPWPL